VVLLPLNLWKSLRDGDEIPPVVVGKNHLEAMRDCAVAGPPDWFIANQPSGRQDFFDGLAVMKESDAPS
jgi:hypothetical protein